MERIFGDASRKRAIKLEFIRYKGTEKIQPVQIKIGTVLLLQNAMKSNRKLVKYFVEWIMIFSTLYEEKIFVKTVVGNVCNMMMNTNKLKAFVRQEKLKENNLILRFCEKMLLINFVSN